MGYSTRAGRVGQFRTVIDVIPVITAGAYSVNDALGGQLQFAAASVGAGDTGVIELVRIVDRAQQQVSLDLVFFDQAFTATADNAPFDPTDADLENCLGWFNVPQSAYNNFAGNAVALVAPLGVDGRGFPFWTVGTDSLYAQLVVRSGPPTFVATSDIRVRLLVRRD